MKSFFTRITLFFLLWGAFLTQMQATHVMGVDISYQCVGPCTYRIFHKTYYDCSGAATSPYIPISPANPATVGFASLNALNFSCGNPAPQGQWQLFSWREVTPICPNVTSQCSGGFSPIAGVAEAVFFRDYNFCNVNCNEVEISWNLCCRNSTITSGADDEGIYTGQTVIDLTIAPCNSSPTFINEPVPYICTAQPFTFNQGAFDPDGDSLSYELGPCLAGAGNQVTYSGANGYSPQQPLGDSWDVQIDPFTGDVTITPDPTGNQVIGVMCVVVREWRDGVQIGSVVRDMQITAIPGCTSPNPVTGGIQNLTIGPDAVPADPLTFNQVRTCAGAELCFEIPVISQDPSLNYTMTWDESIPGATLSDASNPLIVNSVSGPSPVARFCWTPPANAEGAYFFRLTVKDDACPIPGLNQFTIIIFVEDVMRNTDAVATPISCNEVELQVFPNTTIPSQYSGIFPSTQWAGNGNLNFNPFTDQDSLRHLYPAPNTYFYNVTVSDTFGCSTSLQGIANLNSGVTSNAGPDITICSNYVVQLGTPALPGLQYLWTPDTLLNDPTQAQPTFSFPNNGQIQASFDYVVQVTDGICSTVDYARITVNPSLDAEISPATPSICRGDSVMLYANSNLGVGNTFLWSTGETTDSIMVSPTDNTTYSVVAFNNGCSSDEVFVTVNIQDGPEVDISGDQTVCEGSSANLAASGAATYAWGDMAFASSSITFGVNNDTTVYVVGFNSIGCPGDTAYSSVTVAPIPQPSFSAPAACEENELSFTDQTFLPTGQVNEWRWDFGDNSVLNTTNGSNVSHQYDAPGTYDVLLNVVSDEGCGASITQQIEVFEVPEADFTFTNVCEGSPNAFSDVTVLNPGANITSYDWNFGDGNTGAGPNPTHLYANFGYYNVQLTVETEQGCIDDYTRTVFVNPNPVADFEIISACEDSLVLASTASTVEGSLDFIQSHEWNFGDPAGGPSNTSTVLNPSYVYETPNTYLVTLRVTTANGCADEYQEDITIYPSPRADFTVDLRCENEFTEFTELSTVDPATPIRRWSWDFGNGRTSNQQNPTNRYFGDGPGVYDVQLAVSTGEGCVDTLVKPVTIHPMPRSRFVARPVCISDSIAFLNNSFIATGNIVEHEWDYGDGNTQLGLFEPAHRYSTAGFYNVSLTTTSDSGCVNTYVREVELYPLPEITRILDDSVCFGQRATLAVVAPSDVTINWYSSLTEGTPFHQGNAYTSPALPFETTYFVQPESPEGCVNDRQDITGFIYDQQDMTLTPSTNKVDMPLAVVEFMTNATIELVEWNWRFGDGNGSNQPTPSHEYLFPGQYEVSVTATDLNGCELTDNTVVEVRKVTGVYLPTAFTPNRDGENDNYYIGAWNVSELQLQIFNRWGQLVYETLDPSFQWDGTAIQGSPVPEGVYVVVVKASDIDGNEINETESLTIIR